MVVAGNVDARDEVAAILAAGGVPHVLADNVVPRIGVLAPDSARAAIREMFLAHVIGGKHLSSRADFTAMVRGATPDVVLTGVELLARGLDGQPGAGDVVVVDVGGATTDVHSVVEPDPDNALPRTAWPARWWPPPRSPAPSRATSACAGPRPPRSPRRTRPGSTWPTASTRPPPPAPPTPTCCPHDDEAADQDEAIAALASGIALRRHAGRARVVLSTADDPGGAGRVVERSGKDLREVDLLLASGGVFRNGRPGVEQRVLAGLVGERRGRLAAAPGRSGGRGPRLRARRGGPAGSGAPGGGVPPHPPPGRWVACRRDERS